VVRAWTGWFALDVGHARVVTQGTRAAAGTRRSILERLRVDETDLDAEPHGVLGGDRGRIRAVFSTTMYPAARLCRLRRRG